MTAASQRDEMKWTKKKVKVFLFHFLEATKRNSRFVYLKCKKKAKREIFPPFYVISKVWQTMMLGFIFFSHGNIKRLLKSFSVVGVMVNWDV